MSKTMKRKHLQRQALLDEITHLNENQEIVKIINSPGNNLHEAENSQGNVFLVSMPSKFRKSVWVKRNDFAIVESIEEGDKVKAEVVEILNTEKIKALKAEGQWPQRFCNKNEQEQHGDLYENNNRTSNFGNMETESDSSTSE